MACNGVGSGALVQSIHYPQNETQNPFEIEDLFFSIIKFKEVELGEIKNVFCVNRCTQKYWQGLVQKWDGVFSQNIGSSLTEALNERKDPIKGSWNWRLFLSSLVGKDCAQIVQDIQNPKQILGTSFFQSFPDEGEVYKGNQGWLGGWYPARFLLGDEWAPSPTIAAYSKACGDLIEKNLIQEMTYFLTINGSLDTEHLKEVGRELNERSVICHYAISCLSTVCRGEEIIERTLSYFRMLQPLVTTSFTHFYVPELLLSQNIAYLMENEQQEVCLPLAKRFLELSEDPSVNPVERSFLSQYAFYILRDVVLPSHGLKDYLRKVFCQNPQTLTWAKETFSEILSIVGNPSDLGPQTHHCIRLKKIKQLVSEALKCLAENSQ